MKTKFLFTLLWVFGSYLQAQVPNKSDYFVFIDPQEASFISGTGTTLKIKNSVPQGYKMPIQVRQTGAITTSGTEKFLRVSGNASSKLVESLTAIMDPTDGYPTTQWSQQVGSDQDPVFLVAGKFPTTGFSFALGDWVTNPSDVRFCNFNFNTTTSSINCRNQPQINIDQKLSDLITTNVPVVFSISEKGGVKIIKKNGITTSEIKLTSAGKEIKSFYPLYANPTNPQGIGTAIFNLQLPANTTGQADIYGYGVLKAFDYWYDKDTSTASFQQKMAAVNTKTNSFVCYTNVFGATPTTLSTPASTITPTGATLNWNATTGITYKVEYKLKTATVWTTANAAVSTGTLNLTGLLPGTAYDWRVTPTCSNTPSATINFTTLCAAPTLLPSDITPNTAKLNWTPTAGITYKVEYKLSTAAATAWITANAAVSGNSLTLSALSPGTYNWQLTPNCGAAVPGSNFTILDYAKAPNSYIFDANRPLTDVGLIIPVAKAYRMWEKGLLEENPTIFNNSSTLTPELIWEEVPGLIRGAVTMDNKGTTNTLDDELAIQIDRAKGKGNAVVGVRDAGGVLRWSWHIWVTDDPREGVRFAHSINTTNQEKDKNGNPFIPFYMDRNLGASSANFLGADWHKSGGLMYQFGRKDPFPPARYKDDSAFSVFDRFGRNVTITNEANTSSSHFTNLRNSVRNPIVMSLGERRLNDNSADVYNNSNLWNSISNSISETTVKNYPDKSSYDPCPNGYRVPSYFKGTSNNNTSRDATLNQSSPWSRSDGADAGVNSINDTNDGLRIYPGLGSDFNYTQRNIGLMPITGFHDAQSGSFIDNRVTIAILSASKGSSNFSGNVRGLWIENDPHNYSTGIFGLRDFKHLDNWGLWQTGAVRCMADPNVTISNYDFGTTKYLTTANLAQDNYTTGINNPNSYMLPTYAREPFVATNQINGRTVTIPLNKAYAMYNQYLTDHVNLATVPGTRAVSIYWTDNRLLVNPPVFVNPSGAVITNPTANDFIRVTLADGQSGNAVVAFHENGIATNNVLWSWHIWAPADAPAEFTYTNQQTLPNPPVGMINPTRTGVPPLTTTFMDRNLGAWHDLPSSITKSTPLIEIQRSAGLHYQWGRKDPIPSFHLTGMGGNLRFYTIYSINNTGTITSQNYETNFTTLFSSIQNNTMPRNVLSFATRNPLNFIHQNNGIGSRYEDLPNITITYDWLAPDGTRHVMPNRWGHGTEKSPFDPCPDGWRVPDVSFPHLGENTVASNASAPHQRGTSPWFYQENDPMSFGITQATKAPPLNMYLGVLLQDRREGDIDYWYALPGWSLNNPLFRIGTFPAAGIRGAVGGNNFRDASMERQLDQTSGIDNTYFRTGVWTAALSDSTSLGGWGIGMEIYGGYINYNFMYSAVGHHPQAGMSVRCAKHRDDSPNTTQFPNMTTANRRFVPTNYRAFTPDPVTPTTRATSGSTLRSMSVKSSLVEETKALSPAVDVAKLEMYPNPLQEVLYIQTTENLVYTLHNMAGALVSEGKVVNNQINVSALASGIYIIRLVNPITNQLYLNKIIKQ